jgi:type I restriction enzyme R subunit
MTMTNFDHFKSDPQFKTFVDVAIMAEKLIHLDPSTCIINCRRALELAVKWMYSVDGDLIPPYRDNLASLIHTEEFQEILDPDLWPRIRYIQKAGNLAVHTEKKMTFEAAALALQNLYYFIDFVACCYGETYEAREFDASLLKIKPKKAVKPKLKAPAVDLKALIEENKALKAELTKRREEQAPSYTVKPLDMTEYETRKIYIDMMLMDAGWTEGRDWRNEVEVDGMPNASGKGYADYVLYDDRGRPLAVVEAKKTCVDVGDGRRQAVLYANSLEQQYGRRPVIFLTNGFETRIIDGQYPERRCAEIYAKRDLEKWFNLLTMRTSLKTISVNPDIAGRYYQEAAIRAVCDSFDQKNRRKALLVMATGSGKTRTVIALVDVLLKAGWIKNVLFLADRTALVLQAKRSFVNNLPELSCANLCAEKDRDYNAHVIFSTYQTMIHLIDDTKDDQGKIFSCGHFDLVITDEAHRSIYNKYRDIFTYFDAPLVGLTATPKNEIDKNTYALFDLESGVPTYGYELAQAVKDGYLVDFRSVETQLKFVEKGIVYDELSDEDKKAYEATFADPEGNLPERINSSAMNSWIFNKDTIRRVLDTLMTKGQKIEYGEKIGKTIIFAKNHAHAEKIYAIFRQEYPNLPDDYAMVIDNHVKYAQSAIDAFSDPKKLPQIAISVDMLDTGIDVPEILNLVFFKKVLSKAKFWQMIGRGTRLCPGVIDGQDKQMFYIFDFCGNFEFFRENPNGVEVPNLIPLQGALFGLKLQMVYKLQSAVGQSQALADFRNKLITELAAQVAAVKEAGGFRVRQHLRYVELYAKPESYAHFAPGETKIVADELELLIQPDEDDADALRFDALMFKLELAHLGGKRYSRGESDLLKKTAALSCVTTIPQVQAQMALMHKILNTDYLERADVMALETIRMALRDLIKFIPKDKKPIYNTNFEDEVLKEEWNEAYLENDDLANYKQKAAFYIRNHANNIAIAKLKTNQPLTETDVRALEDILWNKVGTKQDYEKEIGPTPLGEFVRSIVGLDMNAAKEAFAHYVDAHQLDSRQIYFVNQIIEYIVHNGLLKDLSILQDAPFTDRGNVVELFSDDLDTWQNIRKAIDGINANAEAG